MSKGRRPAISGLLAAALCVGATASTLAAQETVVEEQVPLDLQGRLLRIDPDLARALGLFGDLAGVREILLLRGPDGYVLEVTRRRGGLLVRERRPMTESEAEALRAEVSTRLAARAPAALHDRSGRTLLVATTTGAGLGFYAWAVPVILNVDDTKGQVGLYMLVASASFFGPWLWSADRPVTLGMANGAFWGVTRGIVHGIAAHRVLAGPGPEVDCVSDPDPRCYERADEERDRWGRQRTLSALAFSVGEGLAALGWTKAADASAGDAHLVGIVSDFGAALSPAAGVVVAGDGLEETATWGLVLAGAAAGIPAGVALRNARDHSWGDAEVFRAVGLLGALTGATAADLVANEQERLVAGLVLGGALGGLVLGDWLVRPRDLGAGQGLLVDLGTIAGGLLGAGVAVLTASDEPDETALLLLTTAGAWGGFGATFAAVEDREPGGAGDGGRGGRGGEDGGPGQGPRLRLDVVPFPDAARGGPVSVPPLALRLSLRF